MHATAPQVKLLLKNYKSSMKSYGRQSPGFHENLKTALIRAGLYIDGFADNNSTGKPALLLHLEEPAC